jgi:hypothetical protein
MSTKQAQAAMARQNAFLSRVEAHKAATPSRDPHAIRISDMPEEVPAAALHQLSKIIKSDLCFVELI